jgi:mycoredoxin
MSKADEIVIYGNSHCGGVHRARLFLDDHKVAYRYVDIDQDEAAAKHLESVARGFRSVPTLEWPDGSVLVEPSDAELAKRCGVEL